MTNLDFTDAELIALITHHVGNKSREENIALSSETTLLGEDTKGLLMKYFLQPIRPEEFYCFNHPVELAMNDVFSMADRRFLTTQRVLSLFPKIWQNCSTTTRCTQKSRRAS